MTAAEPVMSSLTPAVQDDTLQHTPIPRKSINVKTTKPRPHICAVCTRAFARLEHLRRHERSHTNEKPYQCAVCGRCFARRDLVLRHQLKLHQIDTMKPEHVIMLPNNTNANAALPSQDQCTLNMNSPMSTGEINSDNASHDDSEKIVENSIGSLAGPQISPGCLASRPEHNPDLSLGSLFQNTSFQHFRQSLQGTDQSFKRHNSVSLPVTQSSRQVSLHRRVLSPIDSRQFSTDALNIMAGDLLSNVNLSELSGSEPVSLSTVPSLDSDEGTVFNFNSALPLHMRIHRSHLHSSPSPSQISPQINSSGVTHHEGSSPRPLNNPISFDINFQGNYQYDSEPSAHLNEFNTPIASAIDVDDPNLKELLGDIDMETLCMVDWSNIENLDIDSIMHLGDVDNSQSVSPALINKKQQSLKNLQQYFTSTAPDAKSNCSMTLHKQKSLKNLQQYFVDHYPEHAMRSCKDLQVRFKMDPGEPTTTEVTHAHPRSAEGVTNFRTCMTPKIPRDATPFTIGDDIGIVDGERTACDGGMSPRSTCIPQAFHAPNKRSKLNVLGENVHLDASLASLSSQRILTSTDDWLKEIISAPFDNNFPAPSHNIGFVEPLVLLRVHSPHSNSTVDIISSESPNEISTLFRSRQIDLIKHSSSTNLQALALGHCGQINGLEANFEPSSLNSGNFNYVSDELRRHIIFLSSLNEQGFPPVQDLNNYMRLYELELNKYFPFIHLPSLKSANANDTDNIPLLLSMAAVGALFSYHSSNAYLLFNLSKLHIQRFFEKEVSLESASARKVPLMAHQCLVLHIYISLFMNEANMADITSRQIKSMIGLIKSTRFNEPLDQLVSPPRSALLHAGTPFDSLDAENRSLVSSNFEYFIMAQSRIRTLHVFYMLQSFRASLIGFAIQFDSSLLRSGTNCRQENLWQSSSALQWLERVPTFVLLWSIQDFSNDEPMDSLARLLHYRHDFKLNPPSLSHSNLLTMLMYIHEQLQVRISAMPGPFNLVSWRLNHRPHLSDLVTTWELIFTRMDGPLYIDSSNRNLLITNNDLKLILPLYWFLKIKLLTNVNPFMSAVMSKQWLAMNYHLNVIRGQERSHEGCKQSIPCCLDIFKLWVYNIETIMYDLSDTVLRTPVFFLACMCAATLVFSVYMETIEEMARGNGDLSSAEVISWVDCHGVVLMLEQSLSPLLKSLYLDFLTKEADSAFATIKDDDDDGVTNIRALMEEKELIVTRLRLEEGNLDAFNRRRARVDIVTSEIKSAICGKRLSIKSLYLGIRVLADAPVWPVSMGLAEALKHRATCLTGR